MSVKNPLNVVLCWHMHQPYYRSATQPDYRLPWVYLHAIKDYIDMAALLEADGEAKVVINFAPVLLEQIDDYVQQIRAWADGTGSLSDPLLAALAGDYRPDDPEAKLALIHACLKANDKNLIQRFEPYRRLAAMARAIDDQASATSYLSDQYLTDLIVWYHLAWLGETVRRNHSASQKFIEKGRDYTKEDRRELLKMMGELMASIVPRYRALADAGLVELSFTPYAHPIVPLLLDFQSAREAMPGVALPSASKYPGGYERAVWHFQEGMKVFEQHFGRRPVGCWPSEGSIDGATVKLAAEMGVRWVASGENVMRNSIARKPKLEKKLSEGCIHRPFRLRSASTICFFRDDGLSDLIGFTYSDWHADDAVSNFIHHLENIAKHCADNPHNVVSIVLDGENAWEHYHENGYYFLSTLYRRLVEHPDINLVTFSDIVDQGSDPVMLDEIVGGSWVYGTFSTWIGDKDKNAGWDLLCHAKETFDKVMQTEALSDEKRRLAIKQLAICEGSDWFWWFGDYNPSDSVSDFDQLFRLQLQELYQLLDQDIPESLSKRISYGGGTPATGGVMRKGSEK